MIMHWLEIIKLLRFAPHTYTIDFIPIDWWFVESVWMNLTMQYFLIVLLPCYLQPDDYVCPQCRAPKRRFSRYDVNTGKPIGGGLPPIGVIVGLLVGIGAAGALVVYGLQWCYPQKIWWSICMFDLLLWKSYVMWNDNINSETTKICFSIFF